MHEDDFEAGLRRSQRRKQIIVIALGVLVLGGVAALLGHRLLQKHEEEHYEPPTHALSDAQRKELATALENSRKLIEEADRPWRAAVAAVDPKTIADDAPPCPALERFDLDDNPQAGSYGSWHLPEPPIDRFKGGSSASLSRTPFPVHMVRGVIPPHSPEATIRLGQLESMSRQLSQDTHRTFEDRLGEATMDKLETTDVLLIFDVVREPEGTGDPHARDRFKPGAIVARGWAFDHETNQVVCAGLVTAQSSTTVDTGTTNLNDDLLTNTVRAIPEGVRKLPDP
jgi:hypothetical protein